jgi:hypothetical protein
MGLLTIDMGIRALILPSLATLFCFMGFQSCYYDIEEELYPYHFCDTTSLASYNQKVSPILTQHCFGCHSGASPSGSVSLDSYEAVKQHVDDGKLSCSINHASGCSPMPNNAPKLISCDIQEIEKWIQSGAQND